MQYSNVQFTTHIKNEQSMYMNDDTYTYNTYNTHDVHIIHTTYTIIYNYTRPT